MLDSGYIWCAFCIMQVMASWHQHAVVHGYKKQKSQELVQGAKAVLNKGLLYA
jgi:hypothetical protein